MKKAVQARRAPARPSREAASELKFDLEEFGRIENFLEYEDDSESLQEQFQLALLIGQEAAPYENADEIFGDLVEALDQTRVDANSGDPDARRELKSVQRLLDQSIQSGAVPPPLLIIFGKLFAGAGVDIGETARAAIRAAVKAGILPAGADFYRIFIASLFSEGLDDPFAFHEVVRQTIAIFPIEEQIAVVTGLTEDERPAPRRTAVGFLLDPEDALALAAIKSLGKARGRLDEPSRRRIELIRPLLARGRGEAIAAAFGPPAAEGLGPLSTAPVKIVKAWASIRDGAGVSTLFVRFKRASRFAIASIMVKPEGVADALLHEDLSRADAERMESMLKSVTASFEIRLETWVRMLRRSLGRNLATNNPPSFSFIDVMEALQLGAIAPDVSTLAEIIEALLAEIPDRDDPERIGRAHDEIAISEEFESWFEADEEIDEKLQAAKSRSAAAALVLKSYLPARRDFWAAQCAFSALAVKDSTTPRNALWTNLALVSRDIAGSTPLESIPLMRQIARRSAEAYFAQK
ncbi:MAG TPA: hypothetical protein VKV96_09880 [Roseiarcus sp.]|nr:hypothetical protein [Roseiarcus sp.]